MRVSICPRRVRSRPELNYGELDALAVAQLRRFLPLLEIDADSHPRTGFQLQRELLPLMRQEAGFYHATGQNDRLKITRG